MSYFEFKKELIESSIESQTKKQRWSISVLVLNIIAAILQGYCIYNNHNDSFHAFLLGLLIGNMLWLIFIFCMDMGDLALEKEHLHIINNLIDNENNSN